MKHTKQMSIFLCFCLLALILGGCSVRLGDLSAISTQTVNLNKVDIDALPQVKGVTGRDTKFVFLFIPFGTPHLEDAVDDALEKGGGDLMTDAVIHARNWWFIIGQNSLEVKGNVVNTKGGN
jgi:hypothetical protein